MQNGPEVPYHESQLTFSGRSSTHGEQNSTLLLRWNFSFCNLGNIGKCDHVVLDKFDSEISSSVVEFCTIHFKPEFILRDFKKNSSKNKVASSES